MAYDESTAIAEFSKPVSSLTPAECLEQVKQLNDYVHINKVQGLLDAAGNLAVDFDDRVLELLEVIKGADLQTRLAWTIYEAKLTNEEFFTLDIASLTQEALSAIEAQSPA